MAQTEHQPSNTTELLLVHHASEYRTGWGASESLQGRALRLNPDSTSQQHAGTQQIPAETNVPAASHKVTLPSHTVVVVHNEVNRKSPI